MKNQLSPVALASVVLAGGLAMRAVPGPFGWLQTLTGLTLLLILFTYDTEEQRSAGQSVAFATVCGFCLMLVASGFLERWVAQPGTLQIAVPGGWLSVVWVVGALVFFFIDLMRMGSRGTMMMSPAGAARPSVAPPMPPMSTFVPTPMPQYPTTPQSEPAPAPFRPAVEPRVEMPVAPPAPPVAPTPPPVVSQPVAAPTPPEAAAVQPVMPPVQPVSGPPPKLVGIYVNLLGEGLNMMRAVGAQDLGRGYYLIVEPMPEGETWQFQTGQVVRCQKKSLASGKHLVATEEAPRA